VPHSYYLSEAVNGEEMETVLIPYRDSVKFEFKVTVLNSILRYTTSTLLYFICNCMGFSFLVNFINYFYFLVFNALVIKLAMLRRSIRSSIVIIIIL